MITRSRLRRKPLSDCTNISISDPPSPKSKPKPPLSNSLSSKNPPHSPAPRPLCTALFDDADILDLDSYKTSTDSVSDGKKNKGKAFAVATPSSCPPIVRTRSFGVKIKGKHEDAGLDTRQNKKKPRHGKHSVTDEHNLHQDFIDRQRAYFAEIDAFELPVEEASECESE